MRLARRRLALSRARRRRSRPSRSLRRFQRDPSLNPARSVTRSQPDGLPHDFQWLRTPYSDRIFSLSARPGWLRLIARESIGSCFEQALIARRQEHFAYRAETELEFEPSTFQQAAGLAAYYNRDKFHCLAVTWHETLGRALTILSSQGDPDGRLTFPACLADPASRASAGAARRLGRPRQASIRLRIGRRMARRRTPVLDASILSDEAGAGEHGSFTGAFVGMFAFDTSGARAGRGLQIFPI